MQDNAAMDNPWYEQQFEFGPRIITREANVPESECLAQVSVANYMQDLWEKRGKWHVQSTADAFALNAEREDKDSTTYK